jgi:hypothetical protein
VSGTEGGSAPGGTARTAPDDGGCAAAAEQIPHLRARRWRSFDCRQLRHRLGCDKREEGVYAPSPVERIESLQSSCGETPSAEAVAAVVRAACEAHVRYGPDGGSPCAAGAGLTLTIAPGVGRFCLDHDDQTHCYTARSDPCGGALTQPDPDGSGCQSEVRLMEIGRDVAEVHAGALGQLGGPIWVPPSGPGPLPDGPPIPAHRAVAERRRQRGAPGGRTRRMRSSVAVG